jgi:dihydrofolate reductase
MIVSYIVAVAKNGVIGNAGSLPWKLKEDLQYFKAKTLSHCVVMGRNTYQSIGKPLVGRTNIVLSHNTSQIEGCQIAAGPEQALEYAKNLGETELFIIGGGKVYQAFLPWLDRVYLTEIDADFQGDTFFSLPNYRTSKLGEFQMSASGLRYAFHIFEGFNSNK